MSPLDFFQVRHALFTVNIVNWKFLKNTHHLILNLLPAGDTHKEGRGFDHSDEELYSSRSFIRGVYSSRCLPLTPGDPLSPPAGQVAAALGADAGPVVDQTSHLPANHTGPV